MKSKIKIEFLKDLPGELFVKGDVIECTEEHGKGLLSTGAEGSCKEAATDAKVTPRDTFIRREKDRRAKEVARLNKLAAEKAKEKG